MVYRPTCVLRDVHACKATFVLYYNEKGYVLPNIQSHRGTPELFGGCWFVGRCDRGPVLDTVVGTGDRAPKGVPYLVLTHTHTHSNSLEIKRSQRTTQHNTQLRKCHPTQPHPLALPPDATWTSCNPRIGRIACVAHKTFTSHVPRHDTYATLDTPQKSVPSASRITPLVPRPCAPRLSPAPHTVTWTYATCTLDRTTGR